MLSNILKSSIGLRRLFSTSNAKIEAPKKYSEKYSSARNIMSLYNLHTTIFGQTFIAPNATIVGEVVIGNLVSIWHGTVIRGDINAVLISYNVQIGQNCVLHTAASTSSGLGAELNIKDNVVIGNGCTLYSCTINDDVFVGANSVILEGAIIEEGAIIAPNSVVPPNRVVPAGQVWGGNPIKFIRYAKEQENYVTKELAREAMSSGRDYREQFLPYKNAYLYKESSAEDQSYEIDSSIKPEEKYRLENAYDPFDATNNR